MNDDQSLPSVVVGRIVRPHGIRGIVVVAPETDFGAERFKIGEVLRGVRNDERFDLTVVACRPHAARWLVGFEGVGSMDEAEALRGIELRISDEALTPLSEGGYYLHDLVGCRVETTEAGLIGTVVRVDTGTGQAVLVVDASGGEALIPFVESICQRVDVQHGVIVVSPPDGLLEVNR